MRGTAGPSDNDRRDEVMHALWAQAPGAGDKQHDKQRDKDVKPSDELADDAVGDDELDELDDDEFDDDELDEFDDDLIDLDDEYDTTDEEERPGPGPTRRYEE